MQKLLNDDLWIELSKRAKGAKRRRAAIAYVTVDHMGMGHDDELVVDASSQAIREHGPSETTKSLHSGA